MDKTFFYSLKKHPTHPFSPYSFPGSGTGFFCINTRQSPPHKNPCTTHTAFHSDGTAPNLRNLFRLAVRRSPLAGKPLRSEAYFRLRKPLCASLRHRKNSKHLLLTMMKMKYHVFLLRANTVLPVSPC